MRDGVTEAGGHRGLAPDPACQETELSSCQFLLHFPPILLPLCFMPNQHFLLIHSFLNPCNLASMFAIEPKLGFKGHHSFPPGKTRGRFSVLIFLPVSEAQVTTSHSH